MENYTREVNVNISAENLYNKLVDLNNLADILPSNISEFQSTNNNCSFKIGHLPKIYLEISNKIPNSKIIYIAKNSKIPFTLECNIFEECDITKVVLEINAELNMMMKMMLEKPLSNFLDYTSQKLNKL